MVPFSILLSGRTGQLLLACFLLLVACRPLDGPRASFGGPVPEQAATRLGKGAIRGLAFMPDGRFLAAATDTGLVQYNSRNLDETWQLATAVAVNRVSYAADGRSLLAGLADGTILLLDARTGEIREHWPGYNSDVGVRVLAWQPQGSDGSALAVAGFDDGNILLLFVGPDRVETLGGLPRQQNGITALSFAPDGRFLATGNRAGTIYLIDVGEQRLVAELSEHAPGAAATTLAWSPDGARLTSGDERGTVIEWDLPRLAPLQVRDAEDSAILAVSYLEEGAQAASAADDGALARWETGLQSPAARGNLGTPQTAVAWASRSGRYATADRDGTLRLWSLPGDGGWPEHPDETLVGHAPYAQQVAAVVYEPQGERLLTSLGPRAAIWDPAKARRLATFGGHEANISAAAWSPDGHLAATADRDGLVAIWQTEDGKPVRTLAGHARPVSGLAWSPDGKRLASAGSLADEILVWDAETGAILHNLKGDGDGLWSAAWSPDGAQLAAGSTSGKIFIWNTVEFEAPPVELRRHLAWVSDLAWHADSRRLLSGSGDRMVILWDVLQRNSALLPGHEQPVRGVAFSPDAALAASGGKEGALILWDSDPTALEEVVSVLRGHAGGVTAVDWSPDGLFIASGSEDGTVLLWPAPPGR